MIRSNQKLRMPPFVIGGDHCSTFAAGDFEEGSDCPSEGNFRLTLCFGRKGSETSLHAVPLTKLEFGAGRER